MHFCLQQFSSIFFHPFFFYLFVYLFIYFYYCVNLYMRSGSTPNQPLWPCFTPLPLYGIVLGHLLSFFSQKKNKNAVKQRYAHLPQQPRETRGGKWAFEYSKTDNELVSVKLCCLTLIYSLAGGPCLLDLPLWMWALLLTPPIPTNSQSPTKPVQSLKNTNFT